MMRPTRDFRPVLLGMLSRRRRAMAQASARHFAQVYLAHHFSCPPSRMHEELFELLAEASAKRKRRIAVAAPRGHAKTTLVSLAYVLWSVLCGGEMFVLMVSATREQAIQLLRDIKNELTDNPMLRSDFSDACHGPRGKPSPWKAHQVTLGNGAAIRVLGARQALRGMKHGEHRPTLIVADDLEDLEGVSSAEQREKLEEWFFKTLLKAGAGTTNVVVVGTILHHDALLANLTAPRPVRGRGGGWTGRRYRAVESFSRRPKLWERWEAICYGDEQFEGEAGSEAADRYFRANAGAMLEGTKVLWPEREDYHELMRVRADEGLRSFQSEKQNEPLDPQQCLFAERNIRYWDDEHADVAELLASLRGHRRFYGACDPSLGKRADRGDFTAIITLVQDDASKVMYVIGAELARRKPDQIIEHIVQLGRSYTFREFAVESNQFQEVLADQLENRARLAGVRLNLKKVTHESHKQSRIEALEPLIAQGQLRFCRRHQALLDQLRQFPVGRHDDGPDALEMAVSAAHRRRNVVRCISF